METGKSKGIGGGRQGAWRSFLSTIIRFSPAKAALAAALMLSLGLTEGAGILLLIPILGCVGLRVEGNGLDRFSEPLLSGFAALGIRPGLSAALGLYVLIVGLAAGLHRAQTLVGLGIQHDLGAHLRRRLYGAISRTSWTFFSRNRGSDYTHLLTAETDRAGAAIHHLLHLLVTSVIAGILAAFAWRISAAMTLLVSACALALMLALRGKARQARTEGENLSRSMKGLYAAVAEHLGGMKTVKSHGVEERHAELFDGLTLQVRHRFHAALRNQADLKCWFDIGSVLVLAAVLYLAVEGLGIPTGEIFFLVFLFARILPRASAILQGYQSIQNLLPSFSAILRMEEQCLAAAEPRPPVSEEVEFRQSIHLDGITFRYDREPVVQGLDLTIRTGGTTAIVGPSGSGKSTIADLLVGLVAPEEGCVRIDGKPLSPAGMASWRRKVGYVGQDAFLFHDTIRANLLWAHPQAPEGDLEEALQSAGAWEFVPRLPQGPDTVVGDRGVLLSGGERQRLALARALLRKPSLLILDEATSNLDSESERGIQRAVRDLHGGLTIVIISHRLSSLWVADEVHIMENGRIVESGRIEDLLQRSEGRMRALFEGQFATPPQG